MKGRPFGEGRERRELVMWNRSSPHYARGIIADERVRARAERNQICRLNRFFGNASSTRHGGHYAANFGFASVSEKGIRRPLAAYNVLGAV